VALLKDWLLSPEHFANPYPTEAEKRDLVEQTGLSMRQLSTWFTNARKRLWRPMIQEEGPKIDTLSYRRSTSTYQVTSPQSPTLTPMDVAQSRDIEFLGVLIASNAYNSACGVGFANVQDLQGASALLTLQSASPSSWSMYDSDSESE
jgi:hypothetical protein